MSWVMNLYFVRPISGKQSVFGLMPVCKCGEKRFDCEKANEKDFHLQRKSNTSIMEVAI